MMETLEIKNFKSIKSLKLRCRRVNIFIGEPNTGKSNILEALGLLSYTVYGNARLIDFVRLESMIDLFYDRSLEEEIIIAPSKAKTTPSKFSIKFKDGSFRGEFNGRHIFSFTYEGGHPGVILRELSEFKFYRFSPISVFSVQRSDFLLPPNGANLVAVVLARKSLRRLIAQIFGKFGFEFVLKPHENRIELQKKLEEGVVISFPYCTVSDTLQRIVFYLTAIRSNKNSVLIFEEPEAHAFPFYTRHLAELIALDKNRNQYFISTHNPYFLLSILEKTPKKELNIFLTYLENYQTKVRQLKDKDIERILDEGIDVFWNIENLTA